MLKHSKEYTKNVELSTLVDPYFKFKKEIIKFSIYASIEHKVESEIEIPVMLTVIRYFTFIESKLSDLVL